MYKKISVLTVKAEMDEYLYENQILKERKLLRKKSYMWNGISGCYRSIDNYNKLEKTSGRYIYGFKKSV